MSQSDYTATIKNKRCKGTGITEDVIRELHARPGRRVMAIVELRVDDAHNRVDAPNHVDFTIEMVEPAMEDFFDDYLRRLTRAQFKNRVLTSDSQQLVIETPDDLEPNVKDVIAAQQAHDAETPHVFIPDDEHPENCGTCTRDAGDTLHQPDDDPDQVDEDQDHEGDQDVDDEVADHDQELTSA